jgi:hypothetical protein
MGAPLEIGRKRSVVAVLASGVVISLTAMTGGIAPAFAAPKTDPAAPTTTVVAPEPKAPQETPTIAEEPPAPPSVETPPKPQIAEAPAIAAAPPGTQAPPKTQAPEPPKTQAPAPETPAAAPETHAPPSPQETQTPAPKPPTTVVPTTVADTPATSAVPPKPRVAVQSPAEQAPTTSTGQSPTSSTPATTPADSTPPSAGLVAPAPEPSQAPASSDASSTPTSGSAAPATQVDPTVVSSSVSEAAKVIQTEQPQTLQAPERDVALAKNAKVVEQQPDPAPKQEVAQLASLIDVPNPVRDREDAAFLPNGDRNWDRNVRQWDPSWVDYDDYYRPVISNPYRDPVKIIYVYQNAPRIAFIPPLARIVLEVAQFAAYSFTAVVLNTVNTAANLVNAAVDTAANVAVGTFFGGGYFPGIGLPLPPPPPPLFRYDNVPVQVRYSNQTYEPFRVQRIVDVGNDSQYGERKVLLDGVTPAWGEWTQTPSGERQFEVHRTQQFPGLDEPREGPLPGDYTLRLASDESSTGLTRRDIYLMATAGLLAVLSLGAVAWAALLGRRRSQH